MTGVTISMLRMTFSVVGTHILNVINSSILRWELPPPLQTAVVVPLHKGGDQGRGAVILRDVSGSVFGSGSGSGSGSSPKLNVPAARCHLRN